MDHKQWEKSNNAKMSEEKCCQDRTRCTDSNRRKPLCDCLGITQERVQQARVPQSSATENHLFQRKAGGGNRYSPGGWKSQRALFAPNWCSAPVRELGVSTSPPGRLCCWAGGQRENPEGLSKTDRVIECNVTDSAQQETSGCRLCQSRGEVRDAESFFC